MELRENAAGWSARGDEREQRGRLFAARRCNQNGRRDREIRQQDPRQLRHDIVERRDAGQERRHCDDDDAQTRDRDAGAPDHLHLGSYYET